MKITKFGHSCLFIEEGEARILIDPGGFSTGFENLGHLSAILLTHQHQDHCHPAHIKALLTNNRGLQVYCDEGSSAALTQAGVQTLPLRGGMTFNVAGVTFETFGDKHAQIHPDVEVIPNIGYLIADKLFYPGDAFTVPSKPVDVLAIPIGAPWAKISEIIDYARAVSPRVAIPVHDAVLSEQGFNIHTAALDSHTSKDMDVLIIPNGDSAKV
jgi:L-ascorbate metabolism protein UlaG (beta-lactamase superfamily)